MLIKWQLASCCNPSLLLRRALFHRSSRLQGCPPYTQPSTHIKCRETSPPPCGILCALKMGLKLIGCQTKATTNGCNLCAKRRRNKSYFAHHQQHCTYHSYTTYFRLRLGNKQIRNTIQPDVVYSFDLLDLAGLFSQGGFSANPNLNSHSPAAVFCAVHVFSDFILAGWLPAF